MKNIKVDWLNLSMENLPKENKRNIEKNSGYLQ